MVVAGHGASTSCPWRSLRRRNLLLSSATVAAILLVANLSLTSSTSPNRGPSGANVSTRLSPPTAGRATLPRRRSRALSRASERSLRSNSRPCIDPPVVDTANLTFVRLASLSGRAVGQIEGSPSLETFRRRQLRESCKDPNRETSIREYPLSLHRDRDPQHIFLTQALMWNLYGKRLEWENRTANILPFLARTTEDLFPGNHLYPTCAIVGNHGNLIHNRFGAQIDEHAVVFRMNRGPVEGFEHLVGSKTTYRLLNRAESRAFGNQMMRGKHKHKRAENQNATITLSRVTGPGAAEDLCKMYKWTRKLPAEDPLSRSKFTIVNSANLYRTTRLLKMYRKCNIMKKGLDKQKDIWDFNTASSGLAIIIGAIHACEHVTVYGTGEVPLSRRTPYQYFPDDKVANLKLAPHLRNWGKANVRAHSFELETMLLTDLARAGLIRKCSADRCFGKEQPESITTPFQPHVLQEVIPEGHKSGFSTLLSGGGE